MKKALEFAPGPFSVLRLKRLSFGGCGNLCAGKVVMDITKKLVDYGKLDVANLQAAVESLSSEDWLRDDKLRSQLANGRPGEAIYLLNNVHSRVRKDALAEFVAGSVNVLRFPLWHTLKDRVAPVLDAVAGIYPECCPVRIQLARLFPGESIAPHVDTRTLTFMHRLHVPLATDSEVEFMVGDENFYLRQGHLYELNNMLEHAVHNRGAVTRIHLLIDLVPAATATVKYHDDLASMARG